MNGWMDGWIWKSAKSGTHPIVWKAGELSELKQGLLVSTKYFPNCSSCARRDHHGHLEGKGKQLGPALQHQAFHINSHLTRQLGCEADSRHSEAGVRSVGTGEERVGKRSTDWDPASSGPRAPGPSSYSPTSIPILHPYLSLKLRTWPERDHGGLWKSLILRAARFSQHL